MESGSGKWRFGDCYPPGEQSGEWRDYSYGSCHPAKDPGKKKVKSWITNNANDDTYRFVFTQVEKGVTYSGTYYDRTKRT